MATDFNPGFTFEFQGDAAATWDVRDALKQTIKTTGTSNDLKDKIMRQISSRQTADASGLTDRTNRGVKSNGSLTLRQSGSTRASAKQEKKHNKINKQLMNSVSGQDSYSKSSDEGSEDEIGDSSGHDDSGDSGDDSDGVDEGGVSDGGDDDSQASDASSEEAYDNVGGEEQAGNQQHCKGKPQSEGSNKLHGNNKLHGKRGLEGDEANEQQPKHNKRQKSTVKPPSTFFAKAPSSTKFSCGSFSDLNLSRPLVKTCAQLGFEVPTPIQAACIPLALSGRDIVGSAVTGSGKTAAFGLPVLERLMFRDRRMSATYCLTLTPTRELAVQVCSMLTKLAGNTDIRVGLVVGGLSLKIQEATLRSRPEMLVATPGRIIDHLRNSPGFDLDDLQVLVLDEADRLLEQGFTAAIDEVIRLTPKQRQTLLFSATMTEHVKKLIKVSLSKPVRVAADSTTAAPAQLQQQVIRLKSTESTDREAVLLALCSTSFPTGSVLVFCQTKQQAHRLRLLFGLLGLPSCAELHGSLSQAQRLQSLSDFREGAVKFLIATDVAARGLDISGVQTVINFSIPTKLQTYLHRIGRTARAGRRGLAVSLVDDKERKLLKQVVKYGGRLQARLLDRELVSKWSLKKQASEHEVQAVLSEEREEGSIRRAEQKLQKAQNLLEFEEQIFSRPKRTWFQSKAEKARIDTQAKLEDTGAAQPTTNKEPTKSQSGKQNKKKEQQAEEVDPKVMRVLQEERAAKSQAKKNRQQGLRPQSNIAKFKNVKLRSKRARVNSRDQGGEQDDVEVKSSVYSGGGRSGRVRQKRGISQKQLSHIRRGGKGKQQFKSRKRFKRR